jgi:predicted PurR-regulated permease PerM
MALYFATWRQCAQTLSSKFLNFFKTQELEQHDVHKLSKEIKGLKKVLNIFLIVLVIYILYALKQFFIPIALALFFAVLLIPLLSKMVKWRLPLGLSVATISLLFLGLIFLFGLFISKMASRLISESGELKFQINKKVEQLQEFLIKIGGGYFEPDRIATALENIINPDFIFKYTGDLAGFVGGFTTDFLLMFFYLVGFLSAIQNYKQFLMYIFGGKNEAKNTRILSIFEQLKSSLSKYMVVKILISLGTGIGYGLACYIFGIKHAVIWGFLAFCLNFIPTIGSIIATLPPLLLDIIQVDAFITLFFL